MVYTHVDLNLRFGHSARQQMNFTTANIKRQNFSKKKTKRIKGVDNAYSFQVINFSFPINFFQKFYICIVGVCYKRNLYAVHNSLPNFPVSELNFFWVPSFNYANLGYPRVRVYVEPKLAICPDMWKYIFEVNRTYKIVS